MSQRITYAQVPAGLFKAMMAVESYVNDSTLGNSLLELIRLRASQINGCAYCIDMHYKDAQAAGETAQRLYSLSAWRETAYYDARERAALAWTEALSLPTQGHVSDAVYEHVQAQFNTEQLAQLSLAICAINSWNRLMLAFRFEPGSYQVS